MCLFVKIKDRPNLCISDRDIYVLKCVKSVSNSFKSCLQRHPYPLNSIITPFEPCDDAYQFDRVYTSVSGGFLHSFLLPDSFTELEDKNYMKIVQKEMTFLNFHYAILCYIPKGSYYIEGEDCNICSDKLVTTDKMLSYETVSRQSELSTPHIFIDCVSMMLREYEANQHIYCIEVQSSNGRNRFTVGIETYISILQSKTDKERLDIINKYFSYKLDIHYFIKQFITTDENVMIGNLDGVECFF